MVAKMISTIQAWVSMTVAPEKEPHFLDVWVLASNGQG
mgnify:CR=1 FL=1